VLDAIDTQVRIVDQDVRRRLRKSPAAQRLWTIPGVGRFGALLILAEIGDVRRFPDAPHLVSYAGLAPSVHSSGGRTYNGRITKQGSPLLRWIVVEAAVAASRRPGELRDRYQRLAQRTGPKTARVALARHLLTIAYHVLADGTSYRASTEPTLLAA
jgi:transposase